MKKLVSLIAMLTSLAIQAQTTVSDKCGVVIKERALYYGTPVTDDKNVYSYSKKEREDGHDNFHKYFKKKDLTDLKESVDTLTIGDLKEMMSTITSFQNGLYTPEKSYAALNIIFGLENDKIVMIFEPIILTDMSTANDKEIVHTGAFFRVKSNRTWDNRVQQSETDALIKAFQNDRLLNIEHQSASTIAITDFIDGNWPDGDTKSCVIPIQEIMAMYEDNSTGICKESDELTFEIIADNHFRYRHSWMENYKMHAIVYNKELGNSNTRQFDGLGVDFAQMCPPRCNNVNISYYKNKNLVRKQKSKRK